MGIINWFNNRRAKNLYESSVVLKEAECEREEARKNRSRVTGVESNVSQNSEMKTPPTGQPQPLILPSVERKKKK
jgi:hypothetical protein